MEIHLPQLNLPKYLKQTDWLIKDKQKLIQSLKNETGNNKNQNKKGRTTQGENKNPIKDKEKFFNSLIENNIINLRHGNPKSSTKGIHPKDRK